MAITMPKIDISFKRLAATLSERSARGIVSLIVKDSTDDSFTHKQYADLAAALADESLYTETNFCYIRDALSLAPYAFHVFRVDADAEEDAENPVTLTDALDTLRRTVRTGWVTIADADSTDTAALVSWTKAQEAAGKSYKSVVAGATAPDCMHIVNLGNTKVTFADERGEQNAVAYLPTLAAILAICNVERGATNYPCAGLSACEEVETPNVSLNAGKLILINDEDGPVRIAQGINSLTTTNETTVTEDMRYIETVEAMDLIRDDIVRVYRAEYLGNYRNSRDNQMLLVNAVNGYFRQLAESAILDPDYDNTVTIDVDAQRAAWLDAGTPEAGTWSDDKVKASPFRRTVYLAGAVKILGSMTDLHFEIQMA